MENFELDSRLANDTFVMGELLCCKVLLMKNKEVPWFVLVPKVPNVSELYELDAETQKLLLNEINLLSSFVKNNFKVDKLNVAAIGNIVNQLHVHVVGRHKNDHCWPDVVWGMSFNEVYSKKEISSLTNMLFEKLDGFSKV